MIESKFTIEVPYINRRDYIDIVIKINRLVDENGCVALFVNNIPYALESYLVIETLNNVEAIEEIIKENNLKIITDKGLDEFNYEIAARKWNMMSFSAHDEDVELAFNNLYLWADEKMLQFNGYDIDINIYKPKVFISYSHQDKDIVHSVVDLMQQSGINIWIDIKDISLGNSISKSIVDGIKESDISILFLSKSYSLSNYTEFELETIYNEFIKKNTTFFPVKLDGVDLEEIWTGLSGYLYYDFSDKDRNIEDLIKSLTQSVKDVSARKTR